MKTHKVLSCGDQTGRRVPLAETRVPVKFLGKSTKMSIRFHDDISLSVGDSAFWCLSSRGVCRGCFSILGLYQSY